MAPSPYKPALVSRTPPQIVWESPLGVKVGGYVPTFAMAVPNAHPAPSLGPAVTGAGAYCDVSPPCARPCPCDGWE